MKTSGAKLMSAFLVLIMIVWSNQVFAFRAPDGDAAATEGNMNQDQLRKGNKEGVPVHSCPELESVIIRNLNQAVSGDEVQAAVDSLKDLVQDSGSQFVEKRIQGDSLGFKHIRLAQKYGGLPVVGGELIVHINQQNVIYQINGKYLPDINISVQPSIDASDALQIGLDEHEGKAGMHVSQEPSLVIYGSHLAYYYIISHDGPEAGQWWYYVDAHTGKLLQRYNNIQHAAPTSGNGFHTTVEGDRLAGEDGSHVTMTGWKETGGNYYLYHFTNLWGIYDTDVFDWEQQASSNWGTADTAAISAGKNFEDTQSWVTNTLGRNSFDDAGAFAQANVHEGINYVNAYWDGTDFHFGDGDGIDANALTVLDIAAHEYGHAVTQYTSNLVYEYEPGALNESYSDIMGGGVEFAVQPDGTGSYPNRTAGNSDWLMGEDSWLSDVALRDLRDPQRYAQPSYYHGTYWYTGSGDNGGVHTNSGVQNFAYYLLAEGGTGTNDGHIYSITGIGITAATEVGMRANMVYLTTNSQYADSREAWISAAGDLGYSTSTVEDVWTAVGVGLPDTGCYEYDDTVVYSWEEISGTGTNLGQSDDTYIYSAIPFDFTFYCQNYSHVAVGSNGTVYFVDDYLGNGNVCIPGSNSNGIDTFIAPFWDDLNPGTGGAVYWQVKGTTPNRRLIIEWYNVPRFSAIGDSTFEVILYEGTNNILLQYADVVFGNSSYDYGANATVGVQGSSSNGKQYSCNTAALSDGLAILFTPGCCEPCTGPEEIVIGFGTYPAAGGKIRALDNATNGYAHLAWRNAGWAAYNAADGQTRAALGDVDGDGLDEIVVGYGGAGGGRIRIFDDAAAGYAPLAWRQVGWAAYNAADGQTWPVCGDIDGDGLDEIIVGYGSVGGGLIRVFDDAAAGYAPLAWRQVGWAAYNAADGQTRPACGDIDGDGLDEIIVGYGGAGGGRIGTFDDAVAGYAPLAWRQVGWVAYNAADGQTMPACGDIDGDGLDEIVVGYGGAGGGRIRTFDDAVAGYMPLAWRQVGWAAYNAANGETWPAVGNLYGNCDGTCSGFTEDFNDGVADNWVDDGSGRWAVTGGEYVMTGTSSGWANSSYQESGNQDFADFTYEVDLKKTAGETLYSMGVIFRSDGVAPGIANGYAFFIAYDGVDGYYVLGEFTGGSYTALIDWTTSGLINIGLGATNTLRVEACGSNITLYVNGSYLNAVTDSTYSSGVVGVQAYDYTGETVHYDNVSLTCGCGAAAVAESCAPAAASFTARRPASLTTCSISAPDRTGRIALLTKLFLKSPRKVFPMGKKDLLHLY